MGRPAIDEDKKRKPLSVSLPPELVELAASTGNSSLFLQRSVESCRGLLQCLEELRAGKMKKADFFEEFEDILDSWAAQFEEAIPLEELLTPKSKKRS